MKKKTQITSFKQKDQSEKSKVLSLRLTEKCQVTLATSAAKQGVTITQLAKTILEKGEVSVIAKAPEIIRNCAEICTVIQSYQQDNPNVDFEKLNQEVVRLWRTLM